MKDFIIEIRPKKLEFDPLALNVKATIQQNGESPEAETVSTQRLFKISGDLNKSDITKIASTLLVDPVVESHHVVELDKSKPSKKNDKPGWQLDVWPKNGVTDPVGETVEKGIRDLGIKGQVKASSATRYIFPKINKSQDVEKLASQYFANGLIHDINIRKIDS